MSHRTRVKTQFRKETTAKALVHLGYLTEQQGKEALNTRVLLPRKSQYPVYVYPELDHLTLQFDSGDHWARGLLRETNIACAEIEIREWAEKEGLYVGAPTVEANGQILYLCED